MALVDEIARRLQLMALGGAPDGALLRGPNPMTGPIDPAAALLGGPAPGVAPEVMPLAPAGMPRGVVERDNRFRVLQQSLDELAARNQAALDGRGGGPAGVAVGAAQMAVPDVPPPAVLPSLEERRAHLQGQGVPQEQMNPETFGRYQPGSRYFMGDSYSTGEPRRIETEITRSPEGRIQLRGRVRDEYANQMDAGGRMPLSDRQNRLLALRERQRENRESRVAQRIAEAAPRRQARLTQRAARGDESARRMLNDMAMERMQEQLASMDANATSPLQLGLTMQQAGFAPEAIQQAVESQYAAQQAALQREAQERQLQMTARAQMAVAIIDSETSTPEERRQAMAMLQNLNGGDGQGFGNVGDVANGAGDPSSLMELGERAVKAASTLDSNITQPTTQMLGLTQETSFGDALDAIQGAFGDDSLGDDDLPVIAEYLKSQMDIASAKDGQYDRISSVWGTEDQAFGFTLRALANGQIKSVRDLKNRYQTELEKRKRIKKKSQRQAHQISTMM